ncbi:G-protein coupled receptor 35-like [Rhynchocyon petersi]
MTSLRVNSTTTPGNCSLERSLQAEVATRVSIFAIMGLGALLNGLALWVFCCRLRRWTEARIYMVNLVVADCLLLLSLPGVLLTLGPLREDPDDTRCRVLQSFYYVNTYMSMGLITAIAVDRYAAVRFPLRARAWRSPAQAAITCGALWLLVTGVVALSANWLRDGERFCFGKRSNRSGRTLAISLVFFFLLLPVLSFCSIQVLRQLLQKWRREPSQAKGSVHKVFCVVAANLATFLLCFLPLHLALLAKLVADSIDAACPTRQRIASWIQVASRMANANCCLDAFGYYFVAREFQEEVETVFSLPWPFGRWSQFAEIQTRSPSDTPARKYLECDKCEQVSLLAAESTSKYSSSPSHMEDMKRLTVSTSHTENIKRLKVSTSHMHM